MHVPISLFVAVVAAIVGFWAWLGTPVAMPPSPLAAGEKLYCVSYAPFRGDQNPLDSGTRVTEQQIDDDLARLSRLTDCVRTYSIDHGLDQIAPIAARHGLRVMQGLWLSSDPEKNRMEIETVVRLADQHPDTIRTVIVGNEVLLRGEMTASALAATIRAVKARVPVPVTYADVWEFWLRYREVYDAVDFVTIHILPYWEDFPVPARRAAAHVDSIRRRVAESFPAKEVLLGEVGWPSTGRMREGALPSAVNQARVVHEVLAAGKRGNYRVNVIEAFDQPWKRWLEGTVGGHWGLLDDVSRQPKFVWGEAVSNHPRWKLQAGAGVALATLVFAAAWWARGAAAPTARRWIEVAAMAAIAGALLGWTAEKAMIESLGLGGWMRSLAAAAVAIAAPAVAAGALMRGAPVPSFAEILGARERPCDRIAVALGITWVLLCAVALQVALGLVFDPRYRDFPFTALSAGTLPYLILTIAHPRARPQRNTAEIVAAATLGISAAYIVLNESFANWEAVWFTVALLGLVLALLQPRAVRSSG